MVLTWLIDGFRPEKPFPVLERVGEQGSAKSTTQSVPRSLIERNKVMLRGRPKTVELTGGRKRMIRRRAKARPALQGPSTKRRPSQCRRAPFTGFDEGRVASGSEIARRDGLYPTTGNEPRRLTLLRPAMVEGLPADQQPRAIKLIWLQEP